jgi:hypothetical protein
MAPGGKRIGFDEGEALAALQRDLAGDDLFQNAFLGFATAVVVNLARIEGERSLHFDLLDGVAAGPEGHRRLERIPVLADKSAKGDKGGWVGVDVEDFVSCMSNCEDGAEPWEVWVHAYCLVKCGIKAGTGGGPLFK